MSNPIKKPLAVLSLAACCLLTATHDLDGQTSASKSGSVSRQAYFGSSAGDNYHSSFASAEFAFGGRLVTNAPYSASATKETTEITPDGKRTVRRDAALIYRDSNGRTRIERRRNTDAATLRTPDVARSFIIYDGDGMLMFNSRERKAFRFGFKMSGDINRTNRQAPAQVDYLKVAGSATESLGTQIIEGVAAQGYRTTTMIAAGSNPLTVIYERWYAPQLQRDVLIKCLDPRFGEAVFRLTDISLDEPANILFTLPPDVKIEELQSNKPAKTEK